jgi:hypothetical protein
MHRQIETGRLTVVCLALFEEIQKKKKKMCVCVMWMKIFVLLLLLLPMNDLVGDDAFPTSRGKADALLRVREAIAARR